MVAAMTHRIFGRDNDLPPVRELARKTRALMNPVSPKERQVMDTEKTNESKITYKDAVTAVVVAGVVVASVAAVSKLVTVTAEKTVDAVVNTLTLARKRKPAQVVPE